MDKVILYTRVSSEEQSRGYSLRDQKDRLDKYCALKNYTIVKHYEEDHSAKTFERPQFKKLLEFIKHNKREIDRLLILKWDRFSRNATDALMMLRTFEKLGVMVDAVEQPIDMTFPENKLMLSIFLTAPEVENDRRSMNIRNGLRRAFREGKYVATPPLGYKFVYDENRKPILVKSELAPLIFEAFESIATGAYAVDEIRKTLNKKGLNCSRNNFWKRIRNPIYCGKIVIKAYKDEPEEIVKGLHEPIISEELFYKVQDVLDGKKKKGFKTGTKSNLLPLRGFLICPKCGKNWTGSGSMGNGGKFYYYHCQTCKGRVRAEVIHNSFSEWLDTFSFKPEIAQLYLEMVETKFKKEGSEKNKEIQKVKKELNVLENTLMKVEKKFVNDEIEKDSYLRLKESYRKEELKLKEYLLDLKTGDSEFMEYMSYGCSVLSNLRKCYDSADIDGKHILLGSIFPEKLVFENNIYRTNSESEILRLLCLKDGLFQGTKKKKVAKNDNLSPQVELEGVEPSSSQSIYKLSTCLGHSWFSGYSG